MQAYFIHIALISVFLNTLHEIAEALPPAPPLFARGAGFMGGQWCALRAVYFCGKATVSINLSETGHS